MAYTLEQCDEKIAELETARGELALLPTRGRTGKTEIDLDGAWGRVADEIETWRLRRLAALGGGVLPALQREC